jgi:predicted DNA-binding transcriptional regulator YafY
MLSEGWEALRGTSLFGEMKAFLNTLGEDRFRILSAQVQEILSVRRRPVHPRDGRAFERLLEAVYEKRQVRFWYSVGGGDAEEERALNPHHLTCWEGMWFVLGRDPQSNALCTLAVSRIRQVQTTGIVFEPVDLSVIRGELRDAFGVMGRRGGIPRVHRVRLRFSPEAALRVRERRWHDSQTDAMILRDGGVEIGFELADLAEVQEWILSWGEQVLVLAPAELAQSVRERLKASLALYAECRGDLATG